MRNITKLITVFFALIPSISLAETSGSIINTISVSQSRYPLTRVVVCFCPTKGDYPCQQTIRLNECNGVDYFPVSNTFRVPNSQDTTVAIIKIYTKEFGPIEVKNCTNRNAINNNKQYAFFNVGALESDVSFCTVNTN